MIDLRLDEVARATAATTVVGADDRLVSDISTDSRTAGAGDLFVALLGEHGDGHDHTTDAVARGAVAVLVERADAVPDGAAGVVVADTWQAVGALGAHVRRVVDPAVVAITGSVGKTTTKDLVAAALRADRETVAAQGSYNNELGVPLTLLAVDERTAALVVEIGARGPGHIASLAPWVAPDVAVVTAVAGAHLEMFGDLDGVARAKGELVEALDPRGTAVLNADDPRVIAMASRTAATVLSYGRAGEIRAGTVALDDGGRPVGEVATPWGEVELRSPLPGRHNLDNALAALAVAGTLGVPLHQAAAGIAAATVSRWRAELTTRDDGLLVCNDSYNANPRSVEAALSMLDDLRRPAGRTVAVLGHMAELGATEHDGHEQVGGAAGSAADLVVAVGHTGPLAAAARAAGAVVVQVATADDAVAALAGLVGPEDVVLVKASRSAGLEAVVTGLVEAAGRSSAPLPPGPGGGQ